MARITDYTAGTPASGDELIYWDTVNSVQKKTTKTNLIGTVGDASTNTATSVDGEAAVFSGTGGKTLKRATGSGIAKLTSGVLGTATAGTDYYAPGSTDVAIADGGTGASTATAAFDGLSPVTTKGDIIVRNATTNTRLAVGTDAQVLTADSTTAEGVKWAPISGAGSTNLFRAYRNSTNQNIGSSGSQKIQFNGEDFDTGANYDPSTNYRYTAPSTGKYMFFFSVQASVGDATATKNIDFKINGTTMVTGATYKADAGGEIHGSTGIISLVAGDYIEVYFYNTSTAITIYAGQYTSFWSGCKVA